MNSAIILVVSIGIPIAVCGCDPSMAESRFTASISRPPGITILSQNLTPSLGRIGAFYFEGKDQSQVWINLAPQSLEPGPNPVVLNVTVSFPGRILKHAPDTIEVRAEAVCIAYPDRRRHPIVRFHLGGGTEMDLTAPGKEFQFFPNCLTKPFRGAIPSDDVIVHITFDALSQIAQSSTVDIDALGFTVFLKPEDLQSLRKFIDVVSNGIRIQ
jgi:hypothetical protein